MYERSRVKAIVSSLKGNTSFLFSTDFIYGSKNTLKQKSTLKHGCLELANRF